jgi:hypothetical protein
MAAYHTALKDALAATLVVFRSNIEVASSTLAADSLGNGTYTVVVVKGGCPGISPPPPPNPPPPPPPNPPPPHSPPPPLVYKVSVQMTLSGISEAAVNVETLRQIVAASLSQNGAANITADMVTVKIAIPETTVTVTAGRRRRLASIGDSGGGDGGGGGGWLRSGRGGGGGGSGGGGGGGSSGGSSGGGGGSGGGGIISGGGGGGGGVRRALLQQTSVPLQVDIESGSTMDSAIAVVRAVEAMVSSGDLSSRWGCTAAEFSCPIARKPFGFNP